MYLKKGISDVNIENMFPFTIYSRDKNYSVTYGTKYLVKDH